jgi:hypothetical protein
VAEVHTEWIHPEMLGIARVAHRDVTGHTFVVAELGK